MKKCFDDLETNFKKKGFVVDLKKNDYSVELLPKKINIVLNYPLTLTKGGSDRYDKFEINLKNNLYEHVLISNSILDWETAYGDVEVTTYMALYSNLKVEKKKQGDGTTIYILTNRDAGNKFQFASRSLVFPPGWGVITGNDIQ